MAWRSSEPRRRPVERTGRLGVGADIGWRAEQASRVDTRITQRSRLQRRRLLKRVFVGLIGLGIVWQLFAPIQHISVEGADATLVRGALETAFQKLPRRNILIDGDVLASTMARTLPDAVTVAIDHNLLLSRLAIRVVNQAPALRWQSRGVQYRVSDHGYVLAIADGTDTALPVVFDEANVQVEEKTQIVPADFVQFVRALDSSAKAHKLTIKDRFVSGSTRELRITLENKPFSVRLSTLRTVESQLDELVRLEGYFKRSNQQAQHYVDLRIPGRAYWK